ncbi:hypothetical protein BOTBODRAFT_39765 [Botryobasidium botryosum FD-172 SS1]|uniref:Uncharacterized protein n=1 Tax=Botryobasidium botryosum (strain FD-172 SS1) TaxID=930990 RepID=A0A067LT02_BOTB1|nr:hypothetical protein BOTBODRAFT_39765 [Botryobasidium botryosum FD-172 SS1]
MANTCKNRAPKFAAPPCAHTVLYVLSSPPLPQTSIRPLGFGGFDKTALLVQGTSQDNISLFPHSTRRRQWNESVNAHKESMSTGRSYLLCDIAYQAYLACHRWLTR